MIRRIVSNAEAFSIDVALDLNNTVRWEFKKKKKTVDKMRRVEYEKRYGTLSHK